VNLVKEENFCPLCGKKESRFIKGFCEECFLKKHPIAEFPKELEFFQCKSCQKIKLFGKMQPFDEQALSQFVGKKVKFKELESPTLDVSIKQPNEEKLTARIFAKGIIDKVPISFEEEIPLKAISFLCDACMRLQSQYFEAIIQLRGKNKKKVAKALKEIIASIESQGKKSTLAAVTEIVEKKNGFDLKVGSKKAAQNAVRKIQQKFNAETKTSSKLLGMDKKGKEKHRFTFLARLLD